MLTGICILIAGFVFFIGYIAGVSKTGRMTYETNDLPRKVFFSIIYSDKKCTLIKEQSVKGSYYLVSTEVFGGKSIRPKDTVRVLRNWKKEGSGLKEMGYPPLIKVELEEEA